MKDLVTGDKVLVEEKSELISAKIINVSSLFMQGNVLDTIAISVICY